MNRWKLFAILFVFTVAGLVGWGLAETIDAYTGDYVGSFEVLSSPSNEAWSAKNYRKCGTCHATGKVEKLEAEYVLKVDITHHKANERDNIILKGGKVADGKLLFENSKWAISIDKDKNLTGERKNKLLGKIELQDGTSTLQQVKIPRLPEDMTLTQMGKWEMTKGDLKINQYRQLTFARTETKDEDLSGAVKVGYNSKGLHFFVAVHDKNFQLAEKKLDNGSSVQLYLDFRPPSKGLGDWNTKGVHRPIFTLPLQPEAEKATATEMKPRSQSPFAHAELIGGRISETDYWIAYRIPWEDCGLEMESGLAFGLDVGINGGCRDKDERTQQMVLFGMSDNPAMAGAYGRATLE